MFLKHQPMLQMVGVGLGILAFILVRNLDSVICGATMTRFRAPIHMIGSSSSLMTCVFSDSSSVITLPMVCSDSSSFSVFHVPRSFLSRQKVRQLPTAFFSNFVFCKLQYHWRKQSSLLCLEWEEVYSLPLLSPYYYWVYYRSALIGLFRKSS